MKTFTYIADGEGGERRVFVYAEDEADADAQFREYFYELDGWTRE